MTATVGLGPSVDTSEAPQSLSSLSFPSAPPPGHHRHHYLHHYAAIVHRSRSHPIDDGLSGLLIVLSTSASLLLPPVSPHHHRGQPLSPHLSLIPMTPLTLSALAHSHRCPH